MKHVYFKLLLGPFGEMNSELRDFDSIGFWSYTTTATSGIVADDVWRFSRFAVKVWVLKAFDFFPLLKLVSFLYLNLILQLMMSFFL